MKWHSNILVVFAIIGNVYADYTEDFFKIFNNNAYSVACERDYRHKVSGKWITNTESGVDKMSCQYSRDGKTEGFKSTRFIDQNSFEYIEHGLWDNNALKYQRTTTDTTILSIGKSLGDLAPPREQRIL